MQVVSKYFIVISGALQNCWRMWLKCCERGVMVHVFNPSGRQRLVDHLSFRTVRVIQGNPVPKTKRERRRRNVVRIQV